MFCWTDDTATHSGECAGAKLGAKLPYAVDSAAGASAEQRIQPALASAGCQQQADKRSSGRLERDLLPSTHHGRGDNNKHHTSEKTGPGRRPPNSPRIAARDPGKSKRVDARMRSRRRPSLYTASIARKLIFLACHSHGHFLSSMMMSIQTRANPPSYSWFDVLVPPAGKTAHTKQTTECGSISQTSQFPCVIIINQQP